MHFSHFYRIIFYDKFIKILLNSKTLFHDIIIFFNTDHYFMGNLISTFQGKLHVININMYSLMLN